MGKAKQERDNVANTVRGDVSGGTVIQGRDIHLVHHAAHEVDWPVRIGAVPEQAAHYQHRIVTEQLDQALNSLGAVVLRQVLSGTGGVGKTQLAAQHARALARITDPDQRVDVLVWANASTRERITSAYAQAARDLYATVPDDPEDAAHLFLAWLQDPNKHQNRRWLIVWDNLAVPSDVHDLWPPHDQPHGRVLVTTRRRDRSLTTQGRRLLDVNVYTESEAHTFLAAALGEAGIPHTRIELRSLARDLGYLPLALGQAVTYMTELDMGCAAYLELFHDKVCTLAEVFPDWDTPTPLAATWNLSVDQADTHHPPGIARPLIGLIALLDGDAIPEVALTTPPILKYLAMHRTPPPDKEGGAGELGNTLGSEEPTTVTPILTMQEAHAALACLHRLNLITRTTYTDSGEVHSPLPVVRSHQLVQRATREHHTTRPTRESVLAAADALMYAWPEIERDTGLAERLRANTYVLRSRTDRRQDYEDWLWSPDGHMVLFRAGQSIGTAGRISEAVFYWESMAQSASSRLGPNHPTTLAASNKLASWRGLKGDTSGAAKTFTGLLDDHLRILGPTHRDTLTTRAHLARWLGKTGAPGEAARAFTDLLADQIRILGPDHPDTLTTRNNLATMLGEAGNPSEAIRTYTNLVTDQNRILGPDHPDTLTTRNNLATWYGHAGKPERAVDRLTSLVTDQSRTLGPDHHQTLISRNNLAYWLHVSGDIIKAVETLKLLVPDQIATLGSKHPSTQSSQRALQRWKNDLTTKERTFDP